MTALNETVGWNRTSAVHWLKSFQQPDGSFAGSVFTTALVLPSLVGKGLQQIKSSKCYAEEDPINDMVQTKPAVSQIFNLDLTQTGPSTSGRAPSPLRKPVETLFVHVTYSLWVGKNITWGHTMNITVAKNTTFYQIMQLSAERDKNFQ